MFIPKVYFAGKIGKNDWRHDLVPALRGAQLELPLHCPCFTYVGPFFISCDHGCYHGNSSHALGQTQHICPADEAPSRDLVPRFCRRWLSQADLVFAWIDDPTCFGSLVEIGWAQAAGKFIYLAFVNYALADEMWFPTKFNRTFSGVHSTPGVGMAHALTLINGVA